MPALVSDLHIIHDAIAAIQSKPLTRALALSNQDILQQIFRHLNADSGDRTTLFHAALTCKAFMEPALDRLWRSISSFMPLLELLRNFQVVQDGNDTFAFCSDFSEEDWTRFDYYAKRVRQFHYHTALTQKVDASALFLLGLCRPAMFPSLQWFTWTGPLSPLIMLLVSPALKYLDIETNESGDNAIIMTFISALSHRARSLTEVTFSGMLSKSCLALVPKISCLVTVVVRDMGASISMTLLHRLGAMERLQNLDIDIKNTTIDPTMLPDSLGFPELRIINISGRFDMAHKLITGIASDKMTSILVFSYSNANGTLAKAAPAEPDTQGLPGIFDLLEYIGNRWPHLSYIDINLPNTTPRYPNATSFTLFQPLRGCRSLTSISMNGFMNPPSSDQGIADIGRLWPAARTLRFPFSPFPEPPGAGTNIPQSQHTPTILGLRLLAQLCPYLATLQLSLDTSGLPGIMGEPLNHGLRELSVGDSLVEDPYLVAMHLDCLFPQLRTIDATDSEASDDWEVVERILRVCQVVRSNDRKRRKV